MQFSPSGFTVGLIRVYQFTLSPDHGFLRVLGLGRLCRYEETCSNYTIRAIREHGTMQGLRLGLLRILSCHP